MTLVRVLATKAFSRFARRERLEASTLLSAILRAETGLIDADLGGSLIKQRVARPGEGKRGGYRTVVAYKRGTRAVFLFGFAKNERDSISSVDLEALKAYGQLYLGYSDAEIGITIETGALEELKKNGRKETNLSKPDRR